MKKRIAILGSTGSIGTQALEVIEQNPEKFEIEVLTANNNVDLLIAQAKKFQPNVVVIANPEKYEYVSGALQNEDIKVFAGADALNQVVQMDTVDLVLTAMVGYSGLLPTYNAIKACLLRIGRNGEVGADFEYDDAERWAINPRNLAQRIAEFAAMPV